MKYRRLTFMLQQAHAIEIGAYEAYTGHAKSTKDEDLKRKILRMQRDEADHRFNVLLMLSDLGAKNNKILDSILWIIGRTISMACYVIGNRAANWGAKIMEVMGSQTYWAIARECVNSGYCENIHPTYLELCNMARQEELHEITFKYALGYEEKDGKASSR